MNRSSEHIRSCCLNSSCTINYSNLSGVAIIGHRGGGGGGGGSSEWEHLQVPQKHKRGTAVPFTCAEAIISAKKEARWKWRTIPSEKSGINEGLLALMQKMFYK